MLSDGCPDQTLFEFHISRSARNKYEVDDTLFSLSGRVIFANFLAARALAAKLNDSGKKVSAAELNAFGLLDEINHLLIEYYRQTINPSLYPKMEKFLSEQLGSQPLYKLLNDFLGKFPNTEIYQGKTSVQEYLNGGSKEFPNKYTALEELILLWLENRNPAYRPIDELIDEKNLSEKKIYNEAFRSLEVFFDTQPSIGVEKLSLLRLLRLPAEKFPNSVLAQLEYIKTHWSTYLADILTRLLIGMDFIWEEQMARFDPGQFGPGPTHIIEFDTAVEYEPEQFSPDLDWMPRVVLIAKSTYVWLDQLSKQYQRSIRRLDEIPDQELDRLAAYGFTGLWLIGLWQRSKASQKIKQIRGNPEAVASAYSLYDYIIADDLGGEEALQSLKSRAAQRGIRLASDMVPNHMGIDSKWVIEHPDWFIQSPEPPFPTYRYTGPDLSADERVGVFIEDGYWNQTDAAVVFKRLDRHTGDTRYLYHGNDGTSMPWNDTAQLNYLLPQVREAVIQTILHVARKFPIIRFDAAMTLAKKHYQRLWFPLPGSGGDIPSRSEYALSKKEFDKLFPKEFWREVVDRVQIEVPDTLLLAEAFWMMEGYFVRTLGMHRVYNSAFMNMLKNEENDKFRLSIKNVLEFNPQILKRYVNFMNNPDEETAVAQFGKDDKYFGVCVMMSTLPGLPMFGHGQIEGFSEKYGMEYKKAYWDEQADPHLIARHEREIFPLLRKRYLFSDVRHFYLFDFFTSSGSVNENVFAYSNRFQDQRSLVLYNNKFQFAAGFIRTSAAYIEEGALRQKSLSEALALSGDPQQFVIFRDHISNLEYIRSCKELAEKGLYVELGAFKYQVFLDFRVVVDRSSRPYSALTVHLNGAGVPSIEKSMDDFLVQPVIQRLQPVLNQESLQSFIHVNGADVSKKTAEFKKTVLDLLLLISVKESGDMDFTATADSYATLYHQALQSFFIKDKPSLPKRLPIKIKKGINDWFTGEANRYVFVMQLLFRNIMDAFRSSAPTENPATLLLDHLYHKAFARLLEDIGMDRTIAEAIILKAFVLAQFAGPVENPAEYLLMPATFQAITDSDEGRRLLGINRFEGIVYFNKEAFEQLIFWLFISRVALILPSRISGSAEQIKKLFTWQEVLKHEAQQAGYQLFPFLNSLESLASVRQDKDSVKKKSKN